MNLCHDGKCRSEYLTDLLAQKDAEIERLRGALRSIHQSSPNTTADDMRREAYAATSNTPDTEGKQR